MRRQDTELLWIEPWGENAMRVRASCRQAFTGKDWALDIPPRPAQTVVRIGKNAASIQNGKLVCEVGSQGDLRFFRADGGLLLQERWRTNRFSEQEEKPLPYHNSPLRQRGREFVPALKGDEWSLRVVFEYQPGEKIMGMGQYQDGFLDKMGCRLELMQKNTQVSVPFYLSNRGYGFLWNNPAQGYADFSRTGYEWTADSTEEMDYWIICGDSPAELERAYAQATGFPPAFPEYALGFWQSKARYQTRDELLRVAGEYKKRGVPLDVLACDFFHWPRQGDWRFDERDFPDPAEMVQRLRELGTELIVSFWPTVEQGSESYAEMLENGFLVRTDRGMRVCLDACAYTALFDATNPEARRYVWNKVWQNYGRHGIRMFWLDVAEPVFRENAFDLYRFSIGPVVKCGNVYPSLYAKCFYEGMREQGVERPLVLARSAWAGSQRYGALVWSGDIDVDFRSLRAQVTAGISMGISGIPWWTSDIGGFYGGDQEDPAYRELIVRWFEFAVFCPVTRMHGERTRGREPPLREGKPESGGPNEIWSYGEDVFCILREQILLRERLRPYLRRLMEEAGRCGHPLMRPLFYEFPGDPACWEQEDEYLFGPDLLVTPITSLGARERQVYFPAGCRWLNAYTGEWQEGGESRTVQAPLPYIPVFIREGREREFQGVFSFPSRFADTTVKE